MTDILWITCPIPDAHPEHDYEPTAEGRPRRCMGHAWAQPQSEFACDSGGCADLDCPCTTTKPGHHGPRGNW